MIALGWILGCSLSSNPKREKKGVEQFILSAESIDAIVQKHVYTSYKMTTN